MVAAAMVTMMAAAKKAMFMVFRGLASRWS